MKGKIFLFISNDLKSSKKKMVRYSIHSLRSDKNLYLQSKKKQETENKVKRCLAFKKKRRRK